MSDREEAIEEMQAAIAQDRADAAAAWDEDGPPGDEPTLRHGKDILGGEDDLMGAAIVEALSRGPDIGPIEFEGKEDYIRGDGGEVMAPGATACLRGCDIVGLVPELGSRQGYDLLGAGALSFNTAMNAGGTTMTSATTKRLAVRNLSQSPAITQGFRQFQLAKSPLTSRVFTAAVRPKTRKPPSAAVTVKNARDAAKRARQVAATLDTRVAKAAEAGVHGDDGYDLMGAVRRAVVRRGVKAGPKLTVSQVKNLAKGLRAAADKTDAAATTHEVTVAQRKAAIKAGKGKAGKTVSAPTGTRVSGDNPFDDIEGDDDGSGEDIALLSGLLEVCGDTDEIIGAWVDDPNDPGYVIWQGPPAEPTAADLALLDQSSDPGTTPGGGGAPPPSYSTGRYPGPDEGAAGYGMRAKPTEADARAEFMRAPYVPHPPGSDQEAMKRPYNKMPEGAIWYDYTRTPGEKDLGSYSYYTGKGTDGGLANGARNENDRPGIWWHDNGWWSYWPMNAAGNEIRSTSLSTAGAQAYADQYRWGPLVGNPQGSLPNLRYDRSNPQESAGWFWHRDKAPDWAVWPEIMVTLSRMATEWQTDMDDAMSKFAEQRTKDFNDAKTDNELQRKRFLEDAETARQNDATAKANARADEERTRQNTATDEALARQQAQTDESNYQRESQLDQQYAQQQMQMEQQQGQLMFDQQRAEQQAYAQWLQSPAAQQGGGYDDGGQEQQYSGPFEDLYSDEQDPGAGTFEDQPSQWRDEQELQAHASQREEFDGDWS